MVKSAIFISMSKISYMDSFSKGGARKSSKISFLRKTTLVADQLEVAEYDGNIFRNIRQVLGPLGFVKTKKSVKIGVFDSKNDVFKLFLNWSTK